MKAHVKGLTFRSVRINKFDVKRPSIETGLFVP